VVNVSSPNTPGLRDLQAVEALRPILSAVLAEAASTPVLVKIAPDVSDADIDEIGDLAVELGLAGIVATNTTVSRDGLLTPGTDGLGAGGISGPPVARRATEVLRRLYGRVGNRLALISVGGIETADDAWDRITSGASLLQGYTGFIYGGGMWAKHIHDGIARRLYDGGFASLGDAVGSAAPTPEAPASSDFTAVAETSVAVVEADIRPGSRTGQRRCISRVEAERGTPRYRLPVTAVGYRETAESRCDYLAVVRFAVDVAPQHGRVLRLLLSPIVGPEHFFSVRATFLMTFKVPAAARNALRTASETR